jgi:very-short-patch-repair endonuclease
MRKHPTEAEKILWQVLRNRQLKNIKFRRQHILEPYIVDFYNARLSIILEIDGPGHGIGRSEGYDGRRTGYLESRYGVSLIRFRSTDVKSNLPSVLEELSDFIDKCSDN